MNNMSKILWACDFYSVSNSAFKYAEEFAKVLKAEILALNVVQQPQITYYKLPFDASTQIKQYAQTRRAKAEKYFNAIEKRMRKEGIKFSYKVVGGIAHEEIVNTAIKEKADLVIMGSHGAYAGALVGSTVTKVVRTSQAPCMVVKSVRRKSQIARILIPTDLSQHWKEALDVAVQIAERFNAQIYILHIIEMNNYEGIEKIYDKLMSQAFAMMEECCSPMKKKAGNIAIREYAKKAPNAHLGILDFIKHEKIDLVVIPTHDAKSGINEFIMGSVTENVLNLAQIPVIIAHHYE